MRRKVSVVKMRGHYVVKVEADGYKREYPMPSWETALARAEKLKMMLRIDK